jgi:hypothetical protein
MISENFTQEKCSVLIYFPCHTMLQGAASAERIALRPAAHTSSVRKLNIDQSRVVTGALPSRGLRVRARVTKGDLVNPLGSWQMTFFQAKKSPFDQVPTANREKQSEWKGESED